MLLSKYISKVINESLLYQKGLDEFSSHIPQIDFDLYVKPTWDGDKSYIEIDNDNKMHNIKFSIIIESKNGNT